MKTQAPKRLKKEIRSFVEQHERLSGHHILKINLKIRVRAGWESDNAISLLEHSRGFADDMIYDIIADEKSADVKRINKRIKDFCKKTENFGRKHFKDADWLWSNLLWENNPRKMLKEINWI